MGTRVTKWRVATAALAMLFSGNVAGQSLTPSLPSAEAVFSWNVLEEDKVRSCGPSIECRSVVNLNISALKDAYISSETTQDQRLKMLTLIDAQRQKKPMDWLQVRSDYFEWRKRATTVLYAPRVTAPASESYSSTVTTRCTSSGSLGDLSSTCTTTVR